MSAKLTDEGLFVSCPARRRRPHIPAASAATYPLRCFAPQWARFDNRHSTSAPDPTLAPRQRQRRKRYKRSPEPTTIPAVPIPRDQHRQICTCPPRAKGSLNRRSKRLSFPHFFLRRKKCGRRRPPHRQGETDSPPQRRKRALFVSAGAISRPGASAFSVSDGPISSNSGRNGGKNAGRNCVSALSQRATPVRRCPFSLT